MSLIHRLERISELTGGRALFLEEINPNSYYYSDAQAIHYM